MQQARMIAGAALAVAALLSGCMVEEKRSGPRPTPRQPEGVVPDRIVLSAELPRDTDGNGFPDTTAVSVFVFDSRYPLASLKVPGTFEFTLTATGGRRLAKWNFSEEQTEAAARPAAAGPKYEFELSLLGQGGDRMAQTEAELVGIFTPVGSAPVRKWVSFHLGRGSAP